MCVEPYFLHRIFEVFEPQVRSGFARAFADTDLNPQCTELLIHDRTVTLGIYAAEFAATESPARVQITWNGIASLWACAQGFARFSRRMFNAQRHGVKRLDLAGDAELTKGLYFYDLALRLAKTRYDRWVDWLPLPDADAGPAREDDNLGNRLFHAALGWIVRHELAHLALDHYSRIDGGSITRFEAEVEADKQASTWIKSTFAANHARSAIGEKPASDELQFEWRALAAGVGLLWVGLFEEASRLPSAGYPPLKDRFRASFNIFDPAEDSFACEILSYGIKAWIDPDGDWGTPTDLGDASARAAFEEAVERLDRHMTNL